MKPTAEQIRNSGTHCACRFVYGGDDHAVVNGIKVRCAFHKELEEKYEATVEENDALWATLINVADHLCIDAEEAREAEGKPSDVFKEYINKPQTERNFMNPEVALEKIEAILEREGPATEHDMAQVINVLQDFKQKQPQTDK